MNIFYVEKLIEKLPGFLADNFVVDDQLQEDLSQLISILKTVLKRLQKQERYEDFIFLEVCEEENISSVRATFFLKRLRFFEEQGLKEIIWAPEREKNKGIFAGLEYNFVTDAEEKSVDDSDGSSAPSSFFMTGTKRPRDEEQETSGLNSAPSSSSFFRSSPPASKRPQFYSGPVCNIEEIIENIFSTDPRYIEEHFVSIKKAVIPSDLNYVIKKPIQIVRNLFEKEIAVETIRKKINEFEKSNGFRELNGVSKIKGDEFLKLCRKACAPQKHELSHIVSEVPKVLKVSKILVELQAQLKIFHTAIQAQEYSSSSSSSCEDAGRICSRGF